MGEKINEQNKILTVKSPEIETMGTANIPVPTERPNLVLVSNKGLTDITVVPQDARMVFYDNKTNTIYIGDEKIGSHGVLINEIEDAGRKVSEEMRGETLFSHDGKIVPNVEKETKRVAEVLNNLLELQEVESY